MERTGLAVSLEAVGEVRPAAGREGSVTRLGRGAGGSAGVWEGGGTTALSSNINSSQESDHLIVIIITLPINNCPQTDQF